MRCGLQAVVVFEGVPVALLFEDVSVIVLGGGFAAVSLLAAVFEAVELVLLVSPISPSLSDICSVCADGTTEPTTAAITPTMINEHTAMMADLVGIPQIRRFVLWEAATVAGSFNPPALIRMSTVPGTS